MKKKFAGERSRKARKAATRCPCCDAAPCGCEETCLCQELKAEPTDEEIEEVVPADGLRFSFLRHGERSGETYLG